MLLSYVVGRANMGSEVMGREVIIVTKKKKITFRLDENTEVAIEQLQKAMSDQLMTEVTEAQVIRSAIAYYYNQAVKSATDPEEKE